MRIVGRSGVLRALVVAVALAMTGCASSTDASSNSAPPTSPPDSTTETPTSTPAPDSTSVASVELGEGPDPVGLVNLWRVSGAEGEGPTTWLRIDVTELQLWRDCGFIMGAWQSNGNLFQASTWGANAECASSMTVPWLESVASYREAGGGWELTDSGGRVVATLTIDGAPEPIPTAAAFYTHPPVVTDATRDALRQPDPLAEGLDAAGADDLVGRWVPVGADQSMAPDEPHVVFATDGTWTGSDGCNGGAGGWAAGDNGAFLATAGASTLIACDGAGVPSAVAGAKLVALNNDVLRLLDVDGAELLQLERA